jgi:hypothetical protein
MYKTNDNPSNIFVYTCGLTLKWENNQQRSDIQFDLCAL